MALSKAMSRRNSPKKSALPAQLEGAKASEALKREYKSFGDVYQNRMEGEKISITELIQKSQLVLAKSYVMRPSKFSNSEYMSIQLEIDGKPYFTQTASPSVVERVLRIKDELPVYLRFAQRVGKSGRAYETVE
jgi:hypothetical protein